MTYVRRAMREDMREVMALARRFHAESPVHSQLRFDERKVDNLIKVAMDDPQWLPLVAVDDEGIMGIALVYCMEEFYSDELVSGDFVFYVMPERRGTRAAMQLLDNILEWAGERGARRFQLGIHTGINHDMAVRFFTRRGLELSGHMLSTPLPF